MRNIERLLMPTSKPSWEGSRRPSRRIMRKQARTRFATPRQCGMTISHMHWRLRIESRTSLHRIAGPFAEGLFYVAPENILRLAEKVADNLRELRIKFSGRDFAEAAIAFSAEIRGKGLTLESARVVLASEPLK
jgi:hypothetical protein